MKLVHAGAVLSVVSLLECYSTLQVSDENSLKYYISAVVVICDLFQQQEYWKSLARSKLYDSPYLWKGIAGSYSFTSNLKFIK